MGDFLPSDSGSYVSSASASSSCDEKRKEKGQEKPFSTRKMQVLLLGLHDDLTEAINHLKKVSKAAKGQNSYKVQRVLKKDIRKIFETKYASIEDLIEFWMPLWEDEGRVCDNGRNIKLGEEARLLGLEPEKKVDIYDLYEKLEVLFI